MVVLCLNQKDFPKAMSTKRTRYGWTKQVGKLHILGDDDGQPICRTDAKLNRHGTNPPPRPICFECEKLDGRLDEPKLNVLMGEAIE